MNEELRTLAKQQCAIMQEALAIRAQRLPASRHSFGYDGLTEPLSTLTAKLRSRDNDGLLAALIDAHKAWDEWYAQELTARGRE